MPSTDTSLAGKVNGIKHIVARHTYKFNKFMLDVQPGP